MPPSDDVGSRPGRALGRFRRGPDAWPVAFLVVVPLAVFAVPAIAGHPAIAGDNAIQNFPLRALSGQLIRQGHLPLWNPYIWSGNPLLGGLNAGALYPTTLLFAVLPAVAAWVVNLLVVYWAAGLGMYALLRQYRLSPLAAVLGASTYAYAGAMSGQLVHLPIVQGVAWMPLLVLGQLRLAWAVMGTGPHGVATTGRSRSSPWPWVVLLASMGGLVLLTGEPRGMAEMEIVSVVVFLWLVLRPSGATVTVGARLRYGVWTAVAAVWAVALGAVQLLPGLRFISASQRATETYSFFGSGSLRPAWSLLLLIPDVFGGDGVFHQPLFFNNYNLPEVTGYVGLFPLVAMFGLLTVSFGRRRAGRAGEWGLWMVLAVFGLLLAYGSFTPLGTIFGHIPFYDRLRLQSRNLAIVDFGLAALLGFWADRLTSEHPPPESAGWRRWVAVTPAVAAVVACVTALVIPFRLEISEGASAVGSRLGVLLRPWFGAQLVVALAVLALLVGGRRLAPRRRRWVLCGVLAGDLLLFAVSCSTGLSSGNVNVQPDPSVAARVFGTQGRFAIYDTTALNIDVLGDVGQPDLNAFTERPSVQGYGSIVDDTYGTATGTHTLDNLNACALARGDFEPLRLSSLITLGRFLTHQVRGSVPPASSSVPGSTCPGALAPGTASQRTWFFGSPLTVRAIDLVRSGPEHDGSSFDASLIDSAGRVGHPAETVQTQPWGWTVTFARPQLAAAVLIDGPVRQLSDASTVTDTAGTSFAFDGTLQNALGVEGWRFVGFWRQYAIFHHPVRRLPVWLASPVPGAVVRQVQATDWGSEVVHVHAPRAVRVVWSETYQAGWHAQLVADGGGTARMVAVDRDGLIQSVEVPPGSWQLTFLFRPRGLNTGIAGTATGSVALLAVAAVALRRRRRRVGSPVTAAAGR